MTKAQKKEFAKLLEEFKALLRSNGLKITKQREAILATIFTSNGHFTPETLHRKVAKDFQELKTGIATVYRTLVLLESERIVTSISFGVNGKKYEYGRKEHHDHMICDKCGKIIEFLSKLVEEEQVRVAKKAGFKIRDHSMQIYGSCKECQEKQD